MLQNMSILVEKRILSIRFSEFSCFHLTAQYLFTVDFASYIRVLWDVTLCCLVDMYKRFGGPFHLQFKASYPEEGGQQNLSKR
jgi:hypothetical protein